MGEMTRIRERLKRGRQVQIWFWDGMREYKGVAERLDGTSVNGFLKVSDFGDETLVPGVSIVDRILKHLSDRTVDMKLNGHGMEVSVRANVSQIGRSKKDPRRVDMTAGFIEPKDQVRDKLVKLGQLMSG